MSGYSTPNAGASTLPRGEYQIAPSFVICIFGVSAGFCGFGYNVKVASRGLNFHNAAALPPTSALQMVPSGSWATSYGLAFCRGTVYSVILPVVWSNFASLPGRFPAAQMPNQILFCASTFKRRTCAGYVSGAKMVHPLLCVSNFAMFPESQSAIQMLSFLSAITPYTMAFGCGTGNTDTFFVCRSYLLMAPPIIQPTYMLLFESKAMDCSHLMGF